MGSYFTNVQVATGGRATDEIHAAIVAALRQRARETGLEDMDLAARLMRLTMERPSRED